MSVDRKFLDLFWTVSGEDQSNIDGAVKNLCDTLAKKTGDARNNYFAYTRERLVKGLKSFTEHARTGFSKTLFAFLTRFPSETTNSQLLDLLNKHIYDSSFSTKTEESSVKYAYLSCADILYRTKRLKELDTSYISKIIEPLLSLAQTVNWGPNALGQLGLIASELPSKIVKKLLADCIRNTWTCLNSTDTKTTGDQLLFLLRLQDKLPNFFRDNNQHIDIKLKKFRKKLVTSIFSCPLPSALLLLDEVINRSCFASIWPKICDFSAQGSHPKRTMRLIHFVEHVICSHNDQTAKICLNDTVVQVFATQLAYRKHASYTQTCQSMSRMLKVVVQNWSERHAQHSGKVGEPMETDDNSVLESHSALTSPGTLFSRFSSSLRPIDLSSGNAAPKPCQFLIERASKAIDPQDLVAYADRLMHLFAEANFSPHEKSDATGVDANERTENVDSIRLFVTNQLQVLLLASFHNPDESHRKLTQSVFDFLITAGLAAFIVSVPHVNVGKHISSRASTASWVALFRFLNTLFSRSARADSKVTQTSCSQSYALLHLVRTAADHMESASQSTPVSTSQQLSNLIIPHLHHSLKLLKKMDPADLLGVHMAELYATACLFILSQPSAEWNQAVTLLDDLKECVKRRGRHNSKKSEQAAQEPAWSAVLADVLLGLISYPSHMLRSVVRLTFERLIADGHADAECLQLIADVIRTRLFKGVRKSGSKREEDEDASDDDDANPELITFHTDFEGPLDLEPHTVEDSPEERLVDGKEEPVNETNSEAEEMDDETNSETAANSDSDEDGQSDTDEDDEDEVIDDAKITALRESVRKALGPAALDEEEIDRTGYREFTDEEMFARDAALVAAFRANRMRAPERKAAEQARSLCQMKMRCLDLLSCIVQHSSQPELILPTITLLLDIAKLAAECENKAKQKGNTEPGNPQNRQRASFTARYGDLPSLPRIAEVLKMLSSRSAAVQRQLCGALDSVEPLVEVMQSVVKAAQIHQPSQLYTRSLCLVVQFIYRVAQQLEPNRGDVMTAISAPLLEQLTIFVETSRKSTIHRTVFISLLTQCQAFAVYAAKPLFEAICKFIAKCTNREQQLSNAEQFASMQCFNLLAHVFQSVAIGGDPDVGRVIKKLPEQLLSQFWSIIDGTKPAESHQEAVVIPWLNSVAFATAFFNLVQWSLKAAHRLGRPQTVAPEVLNTFRQLQSPIKPVRKAARRFVTFVQEWSRKTGGQIATMLSREAKLLLKAEHKKARQAKRREKALRQKQRREALLAKKNASAPTTAETTIASKKKQTAGPRSSDLTQLKTNPKPKDIKTVRTDKKKRKKSNKGGGMRSKVKAKRARTE